jgi:hypothetical protein
MTEAPVEVLPLQRSRSDRHRRAAEPAKRRFLLRVRTFAVVLILLAGAGTGGYLVIRQRLADRAFVDLASVLLSAEAVPVGYAEAVVVTSVKVTEHARVTAGQQLATVSTATGQQAVLIAPAAGTVAAVKVGVGGVARGGEAILTLYDQAQLTFQAEVPLDALRRMRLGMTAYIEGPGLERRVTATLDHVVPVVGTAAATDRLTVVLVPVAPDRATVSTLVPGLRFSARVDTSTAPDAVPAVNTG